MKRLWSVQHSSGRMTEKLRDFLGISPVVSEILIQRGYQQPEEAIEFMRPTLLNLISPFCFCDMLKTVERLSLALERKEKVLIYGDYDVDGVTSTTLLYKVLIDLGLQAVAYIPHRQDEGYGLHSEAVERAAKAGVSVLITVDCGVTAVAEVELAKTLNIDVIITDHHEPLKVLPKAFAIINPKLENSGYPFRDLAGVGVAFKLAQALLQSLGNDETGIHSEIKLLDLVALGTIADLVPLIGENRVLVHYGLRQMEETNHPGLAALIEECGLRDKTLKAGQIGFMVAPRINAAGRMDSARAGLELLLTEDAERAGELARQLTQENQSRQETEKEILAEAISLLEREPLPRVIVLSTDHWHHGVVGIVASRLVERYYRPVFIISEDGEEAKGSARGIAGYPVLEQLSTQAHLLTKFGGHKQAAGFSLPAKNIKKLREGLNEQALAFDETLFHEVLRIDSQVALEAVSGDLLRQLDLMAPFGFGNPGPVLASKEIPVHSLSTVGKDQSHLKFRFGSKGELEGIAFRLGERLNELKDKLTLDAAFVLDWNTFRGQENVQLMIKDIQTEANWLKPQTVNEAGPTAYQEIAVANEEIEIEWLDWRDLPQKEWPIKYNQRLWIWDNTGSMPTLRLGNDLASSQHTQGERSEVNPLNQDEDGKVNQSLGLMFGLPLTEEDFREGVEKLRRLGIFRIALAGFQAPLEERVRQRCCYIAREELVKLYRELLAKSSRANPFRWGTDLKILAKEKVGLKVLEELGLIRCLGGTDEIVLEWIPAQSKLELESSLRYRLAKERLDRALKFQNQLLVSSIQLKKFY
ncbi:single-stranded-DNA-specific exonuclease RecJ [Desulfosporosinus nitroreducens]|uniref:Single-stranded-DNA-specific exonuclease RecJ n=1 Tax=Desulfosporosinus nitroreducens TaxID=2018668 RepID=A0ABT8QSI7_9FIRM|nr:single-stranded-DNA-specific exonuclease RecJ [Desulfosporosinus nitroreducens]MDO0822841.1 single-stranded-DNA-specific exonuclease RecJ [Desulfosporosinus nitroreducens]